ncbi:hypothetical protein ABIB48_002638 [Arthrobacter sp. UYCu511]
MKPYTTVNSRVINSPNMFNPRTVRPSVSMTRAMRFKLLFKRSQVSIDVDGRLTTMTTYKRLNGIVYVLKVIRNKK